jgi:hypothetical protein
MRGNTYLQVLGLALLFILPIRVAWAWQEAAAPGEVAPSEATRKFSPPASEPEPLPEPELLPPPPPIQELTPSRSVFGSASEYLLGRSRESLPPPRIPAVLRALIGFVGLLVLVFLAGHPAVARVERHFNVAHVLTTGLPFFLLGLLASQPQVGVLTPTILNEVAPVIPLALGWLGFAIGARFSAARTQQLSAELGNAFAAVTFIPLALVFGACSAMMLYIYPEASTATAFREALLLATAGTMAARSAPHFLRVFSRDSEVSERSVRIIELEQLGGVMALLFISAYYRPAAELVTWHLPGTAWLFVTLGIGTTMGVFTFLALNRLQDTPQFTTVLLGAIAFTAGMGSYLRLSPLSVCFICGAITAYLGGGFKDAITTILGRLERPVYFLLMVIAGALWNPGEWQGWVLLVVFICTRQASKWIAAAWVRKRILTDMTPAERRSIAWAPMGALSVAIVISGQDLYRGPAISWIVTSVLAGSLIIEAVLQIAARRVSARDSAGTPYETPASAEVD